MRINDKWEITGGNNDFILTERRAGKNLKTGEPTITEIKTYHPSVSHCAAKVAKSSAIEAVDLAQLHEVECHLQSVADSFREAYDAKTEAV